MQRQATARRARAVAPHSITTRGLALVCGADARAHSTFRSLSAARPPRRAHAAASRRLRSPTTTTTTPTLHTQLLCSARGQPPRLPPRPPPPSPPLPMRRRRQSAPQARWALRHAARVRPSRPQNLASPPLRQPLLPLGSFQAQSGAGLA